MDDDGTFCLTVDGNSCGVGEVERTELAGALRRIANDLDAPIRVRIQEADGTEFTDVVAPTGPNQTATEPALDEPATGFIPGEQIAVAVVVAHRTATADGTAGITLPGALSAHNREVVLMGQSSGTTIVLGDVS